MALLSVVPEGSANFDTNALVVRVPPHALSTPNDAALMLPPIAAWITKVMPPQVLVLLPSKVTGKIISGLLLLSAVNMFLYSGSKVYPELITFKLLVTHSVYFGVPM